MKTSTPPIGFLTMVLLLGPTMAADSFHVPAAFVSIHCPANLVVASNITLNATSLRFGQQSCNPTVQLNVTAPDNESLDSINLGCNSGQTAFVINTSTNGIYTANASYDGSYSTCLFAITGTPPQATPEINPSLIITTALFASTVATKLKRKIQSES